MPIDTPDAGASSWRRRVRATLRVCNVAVDAKGRIAIDAC
jgi:hypothetical protein